MYISGYILEALQFKDISPNKSEYSLLSRISGDRTSAYALFRSMKGTDHEIAYKNVLIKVHRLRDKGLIEEIKKDGGFKHGAIQYSISVMGLFYLLSYDGFKITREVILAHQKNLVFKALIFPYFEKETIKICTGRLLFALASYLEICCRITKYIIFSNKNYVEKDSLEYLLKEQARSLIIKLAVLSDKSINSEEELTYSQYDEDGTTNKLLSKDKKYMATLKNFYGDFIAGYTNLQKLSQQ